MNLEALYEDIQTRHGLSMHLLLEATRIVDPLDDTRPTVRDLIARDIALTIEDEQ